MDRPTYRFEQQYIDPSSVQQTSMKISCKEFTGDWPLLTKTMKRLGLPMGTRSTALFMSGAILVKVEILGHCPFTEH